MANKHRFNHKRQKPRPAASQATAPKIAAAIPARKAPVQYGKPFVLLEDEQRNTFEYKSGKWVAYSMSIAQCRESCQVTELSQKIKQMTRYEVRCPLPSHS